MDSSQGKNPLQTLDIPNIPLSYSTSNSDTSAFALVQALFPELDRKEVEFVKLTQGINNILLKIVIKHHDTLGRNTNRETLLLRAYGAGTGVLIDREREISSHCLLYQHNLAPALLARFQNGLLYEYLPGKPCSESDINRESVWRGVARTMGRWHAAIPTAQLGGADENLGQRSIDTIQRISIPGKPSPNIWTVLQKWINALPTRSPAEEARQARYQTELGRLVNELGETSGPGGDGFVFAHNDLLAGNVIVQGTGADGVDEIAFIDYEYAMPAPAAFDIASHFAEWAGFKCDYNLLPTQSTRREFLREYLRSYDVQLGRQVNDDPERLRRLCEEVDLFRAIPSFFWGICSLIQATITEIDFNHNEYAERRLGEYWDWRDEVDGSRVKTSKEMTLRECRWAQES